MIIYGYKNRNIEIAAGQFICPKCDMDRAYKHIEIIRFFTLFFIPLFRLGKVSSYIECQTCMRTFRTEEMVNTRGNDLLVADLTARKAAESNTRKSNMGRTITVLGAILTLVSACMLAILAAFFLTGTEATLDDFWGTLLLAVVCPIPLGLAGLGMLVGGINTQRSAAEAALTSGGPPMP
jgi:hypothetical protein